MIYVLKIEESDREMEWLAFESMESGREFLGHLPGYHCTYSERDGEIESEWLDPSAFPKYGEVTFRGNRVPISRFMFGDQERVDLWFYQVTDLIASDQGLVDGATRVDAYQISYEEMESYIQKREAVFELVEKILKEQECEVTRAYHGSEDGEAVLFKRANEDDWHFLGHMDPNFVDLYEEGEGAIRDWIKEMS